MLDFVIMAISFRECTPFVCVVFIHGYSYDNFCHKHGNYKDKGFLKINANENKL
jgi:hypothetical protein